MSQVRSHTSSCSPSQSTEDPSLMVWADVVGGKKKGRLYGAGDLASNYKKGARRLYIGESSSSSAATGRFAADDQEIAELKRTVAQQQEVLTQVLQRQEQMYQLLARQQPTPSTAPPPPPSPPRTDGHVDDADDVEHLDHDQEYQDY